MSQSSGSHKDLDTKQPAGNYNHKSQILIHNINQVTTNTWTLSNPQSQSQSYKSQILIDH